MILPASAARAARPRSSAPRACRRRRTCGPSTGRDDQRAGRAGGEGLVDESWPSNAVALHARRTGRPARPRAQCRRSTPRRPSNRRAVRASPPVGARRSSRREVHESVTHAAHSRATATSSNGSTWSPTIWPCSWPLPASRTMSPGPAIAMARRSPRAVRRSRSRPARPPEHRADRRRVLAARIVVGDDDHVGQPRRDRAHLGALALVAVAAGAEHDDQPALDVRPERRDRRLDRVGRMRIIDIDRRAGAADHRALQPPAHRLTPAPCRQASSTSRRRSPSPARPRPARWPPDRRRSAAASSYASCPRPR